MYKNTKEARTYIRLKEMADKAYSNGDSIERCESLELRAAEYALIYEHIIYAASILEAEQSVLERILNED